MKTLKGSTLIEAIVAMLITMIAMFSGLLIYIHIINFGNINQIVKAHFLVHEIALQTTIGNDIVSDRSEIHALITQKKILPYNLGNNNLLMLRIFNEEGKMLETHYELLNIP